MNPAISFDVQSRTSLDAGLRAIIAEELGALRARIAQNIVSSGQNTTGQTIASMQTAVEGTETGLTGRLTARPYFAALETGTKPWRAVYFKRRKDGSSYPAAPKFFIDIIRDWMEHKHVDGSPFLVATKIMTEGSSLYRKGGREDIFSNEIPQTVRNIQDRLTGVFRFIVTQNISIR